MLYSNFPHSNLHAKRAVWLGLPKVDDVSDHRINIPTRWIDMSRVRIGSDSEEELIQEFLLTQ